MAQCDWQQIAALPMLTSSRIGDIPVEEIDAIFSSSVAAVKEMAALGPALAMQLIAYGLSVYQLDTDLLAQLRPDLILTCMQTAHGAVLEGDLRDAALHAVLGYAPRVVHCAAEDLQAVWGDMRSIADALGAPEQGVKLVEAQQKAMTVHSFIFTLKLEVMNLLNNLILFYFSLQGAALCGRGRLKLNVVCVQWPHPLMVAGSWVPEMISLAGAIDVCGKTEEAVVLSGADLAAAAPDVVVFALCGLPLEKAAIAAQAAVRRLKEVWWELPAVKMNRVAVVDGEHVFSRPGPLLTPSIECLIEILHPEAQQFGHEGKLWRWLPSAA